MTDLVDRLREQARKHESSQHTHWLEMIEAADEIERLRDENFALAANQCKAGYSGEHGDHMCREIERLRAQIVASEDLCLAAAGEIDRLREALQAITDHFADVMGGPMIRDAGIEFKDGVEGIPTIAKARAALGKEKKGSE